MKEEQSAAKQAGREAAINPANPSLAVKAAFGRKLSFICTLASGYLPTYGENRSPKTIALRPSPG